MIKHSLDNLYWWQPVIPIADSNAPIFRNHTGVSTPFLRFMKVATPRVNQLSPSKPKTRSTFCQEDPDPLPSIFAPILHRRRKAQPLPGQTGVPAHDWMREGDLALGVHDRQVGGRVCRVLR